MLTKISDSGLQVIYQMFNHDPQFLKLILRLCHILIPQLDF